MADGRHVWLTAPQAILMKEEEKTCNGNINTELPKQIYTTQSMLRIQLKIRLWPKDSGN